jgi:hypothetical protein
MEQYGVKAHDNVKPPGGKKLTSGRKKEGSQCRSVNVVLERGVFYTLYFILFKIRCYSPNV